MQAVIMAAGQSTRTYPLTLTRPKPLLKIANKTILDRQLDALSGLVDEVILCDDHSKDNTAELARSLGIQHVIVHEKNTGYGGNQKSLYNKA